MNIKLYGNLEVRGFERCLDYWSRHLGLEWRFHFGSIVTFLACASVGQRSEGASWDCVLIEPGELSEALIDRFSGRGGDQRLVVLLPPRRSDPADQEALLRARNDLLAANARLKILDGLETAKLYKCRTIHRAGNEDTPYSAEFFAAVATAIVRRVAVVDGLAGPQIKLIAVDADHTLWSGACGEDEGDDLALSEANLTLQRFLRHQREAGILLALCSHASHTDLKAAFTTLPMLISMEDFLIITGEGRPKSASLASIASELAIAHSAILMIDDNPAQCHEISTGLPDVMTLLFEGHAPLKLDHIWRLDQVGWTREDEQRQQFYAEQLERSSHIDRFARRSDFFSSIDQQVVVRVASEADLPRVEQLSRRCNQFHSDGRRWSLTSIERHLARGGHCLVAKVSDRFGDLGVVAAIIFSVQAHRLDVDLLVISCRALDRDVEACLLGHLFASYGSISLNLNGRNSGRNDAFLRFAASIAKVVVTPCVPSLDEIANDLLPTTYGWTRGTKENDVAASTVTGLTSCRPELGHAARIFAIETLAQYHSASLILSAMGPLAGGGINNSAELSNIIRDAMSTALGGYSLELNDNFFDAGGDSLMAVEVLTELELILDIVIPLTILFDTAFTPSDIAAQIQRLATEMPPAGTRAN